jgi:hypothetical protein
MLFSISGAQFTDLTKESHPQQRILKFMRPFQVVSVCKQNGMAGLQCAAILRVSLTTGGPI